MIHNMIITLGVLVQIVDTFLGILSRKGVSTRNLVLTTQEARLIA